jgi:hypothetical protein
MNVSERVSQLHAAGATGRAIAADLGVSPSTVSTYLRRLGLSDRTRPRYDWPAIQAYYDDGHSFRECMERYGFASQTWVNAVARGDVVPRPRGMPVSALLSRPRNRGHLKGRLLREGLLAERCDDCGITQWRDRPLSLALHHVNGDPQDNRLENLQLLCPNCHSQTENFAGRNRRPS